MSRHALVLMSLWTAACSSGSGSAPPAPTQLQVSTLSFDALVISWTPVPGVDGYELEGRVEAAAFERLHDGVIPADVSSGTLELAPSLPELLRLGFRIRSVLGPNRSPWSEEVVSLRGIRPPPSLSASLGTDGAVDLAWSNASIVADAVLLERAEADAFGRESGPWSTLPVAFGDMGHRDDAPPELAYHVYRVRYGKGDTWSLEARASVGPVHLRAPIAVNVEVTAGAVRLTWVNRSARATRLSVRRSPGTLPEIASLAPAAVSHLDDAWPPWPTSRYAIVAADADGHQSEQHWVAVPPFEVEGPDGPLSASAAPVPHSLAVRRAGDGRWAHLGEAPDGSPAVLRETVTGIETHPLAVTHLLRPYLLLDGAGRPHTLGYRAPVGAGQLMLVHEWLGDSGWTSETLAYPNPSLGEFGIDEAGGLQLLVDGAVCVPGVGQWVCETVPQGLGFGLLTVARDGTTLVSSGFSIATRTPGGAWTLDVAPFDCGVNPEPRIIAGAAGDLALVCHKANPANPPGQMDVHYAERRAGTWTALEPVGARTSYQGLAGTATLDLGSVHVVTEPGSAGAVPVGLELWSRGLGGWTGRPLAVSGPGMVQIGSLDTGTVWVLAEPLDDYWFAVPRGAVWEGRPL